MLTKNKNSSNDKTFVVSEILPTVVRDRVLMMLDSRQPQHIRENARNTLMLISEEIDRAIKHCNKDFVKRA
jgi:hypothetical protein